MSKIRLGITGAAGFIGGHLRRAALAVPDFAVVPFERQWFEDRTALAGFLAQCDAVVHLAGLSRDPDGENLYRVNTALAAALADAASELVSPPTVYLGSTTHIARELPYHRSKREAQRLLEASKMPCVTLLMANTYGPGSRPFYNSVVASFARLAVDGRIPDQLDPVKLSLIYVEDLVREILDTVRRQRTTAVVTLPHTDEIALPELWRDFYAWREMSVAPETLSGFERKLWTTLKSYQRYSRKATCGTPSLP